MGPCCISIASLAQERDNCRVSIALKMGDTPNPPLKGRMEPVVVNVRGLDMGTSA